MLEQNVSLERNREYGQAGIVPACIRHTVLVTVLDKEKKVKMKFDSARAQNCYANDPESEAQNLRTTLSLLTSPLK